ncbi:hypothetical protein [Gimesia aquarii]|uniref:Uncharacterized protein n=1 Tax=Gimesia aquarii TaxID=2527964 RepID=A0A517WZ31_9PLAN|nr:hypothetical protein [Gimesia aquarii]QDU10515.1 hypothetical protein V202x_39270 [Gimesia aquarii]
MKNLLTFSIGVGLILFNCFANDTLAANEVTKPENVSTETDRAQIWTVQISPAPGLNSYATREINFGSSNDSILTNAPVNATNLIEIEPRTIPAVAEVPECSQCNHPRHRANNRVAYRNRYSTYHNPFPWFQNYYYGNRYSAPALYMYSDLIRSNWYGSPYFGHSFYYNGYRPSFTFGSLQFRGFGYYDRMYNPRIIPFGYQYAGSPTYYARLALISQYPTLP